MAVNEATTQASKPTSQPAPKERVYSEREIIAMLAGAKNMSATNAARKGAVHQAVEKLVRLSCVVDDVEMGSDSRLTLRVQIPSTRIDALTAASGSAATLKRGAKIILEGRVSEAHYSGGGEDTGFSLRLSDATVK